MASAFDSYMPGKKPELEKGFGLYETAKAVPCLTYTLVLARQLQAVVNYTVLVS